MRACVCVCSGGFAGVEEVDARALKHSHLASMVEASHKLAPNRIVEVSIRRGLACEAALQQHQCAQECRRLHVLHRMQQAARCLCILAWLA